MSLTLQTRRGIALIAGIGASLCGSILLKAAILVWSDWYLRGVSKTQTVTATGIISLLAGLSFIEAYRFLRYSVFPAGMKYNVANNGAKETGKGTSSTRAS